MALTRGRGRHAPASPRASPRVAEQHADDATGHLAAAELFSGVGAAALLTLGRDAVATRHRAGDVVGEYAATGDETVFLLAAGRLHLYRLTARGRRLARTVEAGSLLFGATSLVGDRSENALAEAVDDSVVVGIPRAALAEAVATVPAVAARLLDQMARRDREADDELITFASASARARVAAALLRLSSVDGATLRLSHQQIAELVGTRRETTSRLLEELQAAGIIEWRPLEITVRKRSRLEEVARRPVPRHRAGVEPEGERTMTTQAPGYVKRGFVHSPHGNIEYREAGDGAPLILLHGTPSSSAYFAGAFPYLDGELRCIAMSTMGYGASDRPPQPYTSIHEFAQCVVWLMDGLGLERASVFGSHTGAVIATEVAASWPERVDRLIVEELFNWGTPARFAVHRRLHRNPEAPDGSHLVERWNQAHGWLGGEGAPRTEADVRQSFLDAVTAHAGDPTDIYDGMSWGGAAPWSMCHYDTWEAAPRIEAPTLVIHGASSELGRGHARLLETIPRARGIRPPAANQYDWRVDPGLWSREIMAFLREPGA